MYPPAPMPQQNAYADYFQQQQDDSHLRVLSICFYVKGALQIFGGLFALIYVFIGAAMVADSGSSSGGPEVATVGAVLGIIGVVAMLIAWTIGALEFVAAASLGKKRRYTLCFVMAILSMLSVPLGTILGVFTLMVLNRPSVKAAFAANRT